jgi:hypothetical protein
VPGESAKKMREEIAAEREQLADAVELLRSELHDATDVARKLPPLPVLGLAGLTAGFVLSGGIGATVRLIFRRGREGRTRLEAGRYKIVED